MPKLRSAASFIESAAAVQFCLAVARCVQNSQHHDQTVGNKVKDPVVKDRQIDSANIRETRAIKQWIVGQAVNSASISDSNRPAKRGSMA
jgi:hypothetical protein